MEIVIENIEIFPCEFHRIGMSLFEIRNWWSAQSTDLKENYDVHNLLCTQFGNESDIRQFVLVGSFDGFLSVYCPNAADLVQGGDTVENNYKHIDLFYETQLNAPILGLFAGYFSGSAGNQTKQLVILHPYSVCLFKVGISFGISEHGTQMQLSLTSEYKFSRAAYNLCKGHFGHIEGREFFCVAHIDGTLTFFEQDGISYQCEFPQCRAALSPTIYCEQADTFIRCTAHWILECYSYQDLCQSPLSSATLSPIWTNCIGEPVLDMQVVLAKNEYIIVLGERNLAILSQTGKLEHFLKLDVAPKCFHSFVIGHSWDDTSRLLISVVLENSRLYLYERGQLLWAAKFNDLNIVALQRSNFPGLNGCLVSLEALGRVNVSYLGTEAFVFNSPHIQTTEMDFDNSLKDLLKLEDQIKETLEVLTIDELNNKTNMDVRVQFNIDTVPVEDNSDTMLFEVSAVISAKEFLSAKAQLRLKCMLDIAELQVTFNTPQGIHGNVEAINFYKIKSGFTKKLDVHFYIDELLYISTAKITAVVSFITTEGLPRVIERFAYLPLSMFYKVTSPQKAASLRLSFTCENQNVCNLNSLFSELFPVETQAQSLGLLMLCPAENIEVVSLITTKNNTKLRVQSDCLEALTLIVEYLLYKFPKQTLNKRDVVQVNAKAQMPIHDILLRLDGHYDIQSKIRQQIKNLDNLWKEYKILQERVQNTIGNNTNANQTLEIEEMYDNLILDGDKLTDMRKEELLTQTKLSSALNIVCKLLPFFKIDIETELLISDVLCTPVMDWMETSWEAAIFKSIEMLHHYQPLTQKLKEEKGKDEIQMDQFDYKRFRRQFNTLLENILKLAITRRNLTTVESTQKNMKLPMLPATTSIVPHIKEETQSQIPESNIELPQSKQSMENNAVEESNDFEKSEWINENYQLPSSEELFSDLGIWWGK